MPDAVPHGWTLESSAAPPIPSGWTLESPSAKAEPNSAGTLVSHVGAQINPISLVQAVGQAIAHPIDTTKAIGAAQGALYDKAKAAYEKGDYLTASRHFVNYLLPLVGPGLDKSSEEFNAGHWAAGGGDAIGLGLAMFGPKALQNVAAARYPLASNPTPPKPAIKSEIQFAQNRAVPLDAATVSDNIAVKYAQAGADRTIGGALVATPAKAAQSAAMTRVGGELAQQAAPAPSTLEEAGTSIREALSQKVARHAQEANTAYDKLRSLEQAPASRMTMPAPEGPVDAVAGPLKGQLRRIVHELDAAPYTPRQLAPSGVGGTLEHVEGTGGAGAKVFDDIAQRAGSGATRGLVQQQLEQYLAGGKETPIVKAALEVATARSKGQGGYAVSKPELPPSAMEIPTKLEASRPGGSDMGLPVNLAEAKAALQPVYEQLKRQMPITQQQANPGLKAIENIMQAQDWAPLSQVDQDLSAIKSVARERGGVAKLAVAKLDAAVRQAAENGGPDVSQALQSGREATIAKYGASDVLEKLNAEPVRTLKALTAPKDSAIHALRSVLQQVPEQAPTIARAYLEDVLDKPNKVAEWSKLGDQTKAALFPKAGHVQALDNFFRLTDRISKTNVNPSGSGYMASMGAQGAMIWYDPVHAAGLQISGALLSKLLRSPTVIQALTQGLSIPRVAPAAVRTAATLNLIKAAKAAGTPIPTEPARLPVAAEKSGATP